jgi:peptide/nickel transport system permease protein
LTSFVLRRLLSAVPTLFGVSLIAFLILNLLPSDPLRTVAEGGLQISAEARARLSSESAGGQGIAVRYLRWSNDLLHGNLGRSLRDGRPVSSILSEALPWSVLLNTSTLLLIFVVALPFGLLGAWHPGSALDRLGGMALVGLYAFPGFAAALLLQQLFAARLALLPLQGTSDSGAASPGLLDVGRHLVLPTLCLALSSWAFVARYSRAAFRSEITRSFLATVRAKGLSRARASLHATALVAIPLLSLLAMVLPSLVGGSVIVEQIFAWPGLGRTYLAAIESRDDPVLLALTLLSGVAILAAQILVDLLYVLLDPTLRDRLLERRADA